MKVSSHEYMIENLPIAEGNVKVIVSKKQQGKQPGR